MSTEIDPVTVKGAGDNQGNGSGGVSLLAAGVIAVIASCASIGAYHMAISPNLTRLAVVDLPMIYREQESIFSRALTKDGVTDREREAAMMKASEFAKRLPIALNEMARDCSCTIMTANAVAGQVNLPDMTPTLRAKVGQ